MISHSSCPRICYNYKNTFVTDIHLHMTYTRLVDDLYMTDTCLIYTYTYPIHAYTKPIHERYKPIHDQYKTATSTIKDRFKDNPCDGSDSLQGPPAFSDSLFPQFVHPSKTPPTPPHPALRATPSFVAALTQRGYRSRGSPPSIRRRGSGQLIISFLSRREILRPAVLVSDY